jgi:hypothetical protein
VDRLHEGFTWLRALLRGRGIETARLGAMGEGERAASHQRELLEATDEVESGSRTAQDSGVTFGSCWRSSQFR